MQKLGVPFIFTPHSSISTLIVMHRTCKTCLTLDFSLLCCIIYGEEKGDDMDAKTGLYP